MTLLKMVSSLNNKSSVGGGGGGGGSGVNGLILWKGGGVG